MRGNTCVDGRERRGVQAGWVQTQRSERSGHAGVEGGERNISRGSVSTEIKGAAR